MTWTAAEKAAIRWPERRDARRLWALLAIALLGWLPGLLTLPALDRDESRFAQASRQMVQTGDYVDIRLGESVRYNKPVGIYWLQAAAVHAARLVSDTSQDAIATYRVPSFLSGLLALFLTFWTMRAFASRTTAFLAAAILGLTVLLAVESEIATTDAALLATIVLAQGALLRVYLARDSGLPASSLTIMAGWVALGAGILIKGPVIAVVLGGTVAAISIGDRRWLWLKATQPLKGFAVAVAIVVPWAIAIGVSSHGAFYQQSLGHDFAAKVMGAQETHGAPPGYYLVLLAATFWPATLFLIPALAASVRCRNEPPVRFLLAWAGATFLVFELVPTKLPHYILPAYPALAMMIAFWISTAKGARSHGERFWRYVASVQFAVAMLAFVAVPFVLPPRFGAASPLWAEGGALLAMAAGGTAVVCVLRDRVREAFYAAATSALILYPVLVQGVVPQLQPLWLSHRLAVLVDRYARPHDPAIVAAGYSEPSLLFDVGGNTRIVGGPEAADITAAHGGLALIEDREKAAFLSQLGRLRAAATALDQVSGTDYSNGRKEHITIFRVSGQPPRNSD